MGSKPDRWLRLLDLSPLADTQGPYAPKCDQGRGLNNPIQPKLLLTMVAADLNSIPITSLIHIKDLRFTSSPKYF